MIIDNELILKLEHLARLQLSEAERGALKGDLNKILTMVERLKEVDTDNVEPLVYLNEQSNSLRTDEVANQVDRKDALKNAPDSNEPYFKVPKVIDLK